MAEWGYFWKGKEQRQFETRREAWLEKLREAGLPLDGRWVIDEVGNRLFKVPDRLVGQPAEVVRKWIKEALEDVPE